MKLLDDKKMLELYRFIDAVIDSSDLSGLQADSLKKRFRELDYMFRGVDGRAERWSDEARRAQAEKMIEAWRRRTPRRILYLYRYRNQAPEEVTLEHAAGLLNVQVLTLRKRLSRTEDGFIQRTMHGPVVYATSREGYERVLRAKDPANPFALPLKPSSARF